jgi:hypothetical protein
MHESFAKPEEDSIMLWLLAVNVETILFLREFIDAVRESDRSIVRWERGVGVVAWSLLST